MMDLAQENAKLRAELADVKAELAKQRAKSKKDLADIAKAHAARCESLQTLNDVLSKQLRKMFDARDGQRASEQAPIQNKEIQVTPFEGRGHGHD